MTAAAQRKADEILRFDLGTVRCAVPLDPVREVVAAAALTALPGAPDLVAGVLDLRGEVVPVLDLYERLGVNRPALEPSQYFVVVWTGERLVALRADRVEWIAALGDDDLAPAATLTRAALDVAGVARTEDGLVLVHDVEKLLRQAEAEALDAALAAHGG